MKLHEIRGAFKPKDSTGNSKIVKIDTYNMGELKLKVTFDYEAASGSRHSNVEYDEESFSEQFTITDIELAQRFEDEENDKVYPKGTNVDDIPDWVAEDEKAVEDELYKKD